MSVMTKAGMARMTKRRGGGTRGCHMSCDYLTPKQLKELNGEVHTYPMNRPVVWEEFKKYPVELQREYLNNLIEEYNVNYTTLSQMLGVGTSSIKRLIEKNDLGIVFTVGHSMTGEQRKAWKQFLNQEIAGEDKHANVTIPADQIAQEPSQAQSSVMTRFSISFSGAISPIDIVNSLMRIIGDKADGQINIEFIASANVAE